MQAGGGMVVVVVMVACGGVEHARQGLCLMVQRARMAWCREMRGDAVGDAVGDAWRCGEMR